MCGGLSRIYGGYDMSSFDVPMVEIDPTEYPHPIRGARLWFLALCLGYDEATAMEFKTLEKGYDSGKLSVTEQHRFVARRFQFRGELERGLGRCP